MYFIEFMLTEGNKLSLSVQIITVKCYLLWIKASQAPLPHGLHCFLLFETSRLETEIRLESFSLKVEISVLEMSLLILNPENDNIQQVCKLHARPKKLFFRLSPAPLGAYHPG